jgi:hypothetical protein
MKIIRAPEERLKMKQYLVHKYRLNTWKELIMEKKVTKRSKHKL